MKDSTNIYKMARIRANWRQADCADELAISRKCLVDYETSQRAVPDDVVVRMMQVYKADYLGYLHLQNSLVGRIVLPEVNPNLGIAAVAVRTHIALIKLADAVNELLYLAENDCVDGSELEKFREVQKSVRKAISALMAVAVGAFLSKKRTVNLAKLTVQGSSYLIRDS